ncbi:MAG: protein translocase subunit SecD, partial [Kiloniellales bacterium]|nr:protein translocase subunit SecD [Kiloniellales bacterium]
MVQFPRWQMIAVLLVVLAGLIFSAPNMLDEQTAEGLPGWLPSEQINLGLDLQGGAYLSMEVDLESVLEEQREDLVDSIRLELRQSRVGYTGLGVDGEDVVFTLRDPTQRDEVREDIVRLVPTMLVTTTDEGGFRIENNVQTLRDLKNSVMEQTLAVLGDRINELGTREPSLQRQGEDRILIQLPGEQDTERAKAIIGKTAKLTFRFVEEEIVPGVDRIPAGAEVLEGDDPTGNVVPYVVRKRIMVSGANLVDAQATFQDNQPVVSFRFDSLGAKKFGEATRDNVGRLFAIVLDDRVISAPVIREAILGGT